MPLANEDSPWLSALNLGSGFHSSATDRKERETRVIEKKMVGDTGFEPLTSTVCRRQRKKPKCGK
jgi:hypothetical protein